MRLPHPNSRQGVGAHQRRTELGMQFDAGVRVGMPASLALQFKHQSQGRHAACPYRNSKQAAERLAPTAPQPVQRAADARSAPPRARRVEWNSHYQCSAMRSRRACGSGQRVEIRGPGMPLPLLRTQRSAASGRKCCRAARHHQIALDAFGRALADHEKSQVSASVPAPMRIASIMSAWISFLYFSLTTQTRNAVTSSLRNSASASRLSRSSLSGVMAHHRRAEPRTAPERAAQRPASAARMGIRVASNSSGAGHGCKSGPFRCR